MGIFSLGQSVYIFPLKCDLCSYTRVEMKVCAFVETLIFSRGQGEGMQEVKLTKVAVFHICMFPLAISLVLLYSEIYNTFV